MDIVTLFLVNIAEALVLALGDENDRGFVVGAARIEEEKVVVEYGAEMEAGFLGAEVIDIGILLARTAAVALLEVEVKAGGFTGIYIGESAAEFQVLAYEIEAALGPGEGGVLADDVELLAGLGGVADHVEAAEATLR